MEKKVFEAPEVIVTVFEANDILTESTQGLKNGGANGAFKTIEW